MDKKSLCSWNQQLLFWFTVSMITISFMTVFFIMSVKWMISAQQFWKSKINLLYIFFKNFSHFLKFSFSWLIITFFLHHNLYCLSLHHFTTIFSIDSRAVLTSDIADCITISCQQWVYKKHILFLTMWLSKMTSILWVLLLKLICLTAAVIDCSTIMKCDKNDLMNIFLTL